MTSPIVTNRSECLRVRMKMIRNLYRVAYDSLGSHGKALSALSRIRNTYSTAFRQSLFNKVAKVDGHYYHHFYAPKYHSVALDQVFAQEIERVSDPGKVFSLRLLLLAITTRCPLNCRHCYEWHNLRQPEIMSKYDLLSIIRAYQEFGTGLIYFGGGEPMIRFEDILFLLKKSASTSDFWMYTSGLFMDEQKARELKKAGLTGVMVSIDNHNPEQHDAFRGKSGTFAAAVNAIQCAQKAKLVTGMAMCPTREYATLPNIRAYLDLAKELNVAFVQILEPQASGKYNGQNVMLSTEQSALLDSICDNYNTSSEFRDYPIIRSPASMMRRLQCMSGDRSIYINSEGMLQKCPFCTKTYGHALERDPKDVLVEMRADKCSAITLYQPEIEMSAHHTY